MRHIQPLHEPTPTVQTTNDQFFSISPDLGGGAPWHLMLNIQPSANQWVRLGKFDDLGMARAYLNYYSRRINDTMQAARLMFWHGEPEEFLALRAQAQKIVVFPQGRIIAVSLLISIETTLDDVDTIAHIRQKGIILKPSHILEATIVSPTPGEVANGIASQPAPDSTE